MSKVDELEQFETWTKDILLGIGADEDTVSLAHVGLMVRMIYDKGRIEGRAEEADEEKPLTDVEKAEDEIVKALCIHLTGPGYNWPYDKAKNMAQEMEEDLIIAVKNEKKYE